MPLNDKRPYRVVPFTSDGFSQLLAELSGTSLDSIEEKDHISYFEEYFSKSQGSTVVVEQPYVDHDYLEDYAAYYAKCFHPYERFCTRLHFFSVEFTDGDFDLLLRADKGPLSAKELAQGYLGFMVVKPLPDTFIGRTCLRTYPCDGRRFYPTTRTHEAHLFGLTLSVDAVAFQEQDNTVAMCATSALWAAFQGTGKLFHHPILSPVEITKAATLNSDDAMRSLPNDGLNLEQMARAIRSVSLEPFFFDGSNPYILKSTIYAYLKGHIPVLLDVQLVDIGPQSDSANNDSPEIQPLENDKSSDEATYPPLVPNGCESEGHPASSGGHLHGTNMGEHEVAIVGYSLNGQPAPLEETGLILTATRIDKFYAHDDQVGPYARMEFTNNGHLSTSWRGDISQMIGTVQASPGNVLVPLYNKVRIPFHVIHDKVIVPFDQFLEQLRVDGVLDFPVRLEWDIYLTTSNDLKSELLQTTTLSGAYRSQLLCRSLPRFLWRATALLEGNRMVELLFDATDIGTGTMFICPIELNRTFSTAIREVAVGDEIKEALQGDRLGFILNWFASNPSPDSLT